MSTNMVILDIKMLSGFAPDEESLKKVSYEHSFNFSIIHVGCWCHDNRITQLNIVSSQLKMTRLVDRVEQKEDHVLVYIQEVRRIHSEEQEMMISRFVTDHLFSLQQLMKDVPNDYSLELIQELPVQNLKPAVVKIYDYYQPSKDDSSS